MILTSIVYGLFLISVLGIYWSLSRKSLRLWVLFITSLVFYASLQVYYLPLMLALTGITFFWGLKLATPMDWRIPNEHWQFAQQDWNRRRLVLLWLGIGFNVLLLLGFKYVQPSLRAVASLWGTGVLSENMQILADNILFPLGLSFFIFECISYLVDVYRGAPATHNFIEFAAYKLYFPKLISGPITRFHQFSGQLGGLMLPPLSHITEGLWLISLGAIKKLLFADHLAILVNLSFDNLERAGSGDLWLATFAYGLQLYLDFSGYIDIARGSAMLMGIHLPQNFDFPYFTTSIATFWRRWHITLGDWLRNYLYFPLGGSRKGLARTCLNLMIVMVLAGIWHGDAWGFVVWGGLHGLALVLHRLTLAMSQRWEPLADAWRSIPGVILAWSLTQLMVFFSWIFFRLPDLKDSGLVVTRLFGHTADVQFAQKVYVESLGVGRADLALMLCLLVVGMAVLYAFNRLLKLELNWPVKLLMVPILLFAAWLLGPGQALPYIYFDF